MDRIRLLSKEEKRSMNSELLILIERGLKKEIDKNRYCGHKLPHLSRESQIKAWEKLCGNWTDERNTEEILSDIVRSRTGGREVEL